MCVALRDQAVFYFPKVRTLCIIIEHFYIENFSVYVYFIINGAVSKSFIVIEKTLYRLKKGAQSENYLRIVN